MLLEYKFKVPEGYFHIVGKNGKCVSAKNYNGKLVQEYCGFQDDILWKTIKFSGKKVIIVNKTGRVMDNKGDGENNGNSVLGYARNNTPGQIWVIEPVEKGDQVHFKNQKKCLENDKGSNYQIGDCNNDKEIQMFRLVSKHKYPEKGWFNIVGKTGLCVSAKNNNGKLVQEYCGSTDDLLWKVTPNDKGLIGLIIENKTGSVMDNKGQGKENGNPVFGYSRLTTTPAHIWAIESLHNGNHVHFRNVQRNKCLDDFGMAFAGSNYRILDCNNHDENQDFNLVPRYLPPYGYFNIVGNTGLCISAKKDDEKLVQEFCGTSDDLLWKVISFKNGLIFENKTGLVIHNSRSRGHNGNPVLGYKRDNSGAQIWAIDYVSEGSEYINFKNLQRMKCLDDTGKAIRGNNFYISECDPDKESQQYKLVSL